MRLALAAVAVAAVLAGCGEPDVVAEEENAAALPAIDEPAHSPTGAPPANNAAIAATAETAPVAAIPPALQGRWGLTPADCTSRPGDAKGLLLVSAAELRFYESRAVPAAEVQTSPGSISGDFAFTGEGQQWSKHLTLELRDGKLVRTERDPVVRFRYVAC